MLTNAGVSCCISASTAVYSARKSSGLLASVFQTLANWYLRGYQDSTCDRRLKTRPGRVVRCTLGLTSSRLVSYFTSGWVEAIKIKDVFRRRTVVQGRAGLLVGHASRAPAKKMQGVRLRQPRAAGSGCPDRADRDRPARLEPHGGVEIRVRGRRRHVRIGWRDLVLAPLRG